MGQSRDVMADIISAKCFGCGHVVKVPSALGGKKARCPQCTNTIVIPTSADSSAEIVSDDQLPEVAREGEVLEGEEVVAEGEEVPEAEEVADEEGTRTGSRRRTRTRARGGTRVRGKGSGVRHPKVSFPPPRRKSSAGVVVGIIVALVVVGGIVAGVTMSGGSGPAAPSKDGVSTDQQTADQKTAEDHDLQVRCRQYTDAVNSGDPGRIREFYKTGDNAQEVLRAVNRMVEQNTRYENVSFKSSSAASGQTTFSYSSGSGQGEKTLQWEKVDGKWLLTGTP